MFLSSAMAVVFTFPAEREVFLREYTSNMYGLPAYYLGRSSIDLPSAIIGPTFTASVCYFIVGYNASAAKFFTFCKILEWFSEPNFLVLTIILVSLCGNAVGLLGGAAFNDPRLAADVVPVIL